MEAISDASTERVVIMSSAQVGKTEILNNTCGYYIDQDPAPMMIVMPTERDAESWSKDRFTPMARDTPALQGKISDPRSRFGDNKILHKKFPGGHMTIVGANAPSGLAARPIRVLLFDEIDRYPQSAGSEGDPVNLATKRTTTFWNRKLVLVSTPTNKGASRIETAYEGSDQRQYWVPCPDCGESQTLKWASVHWDKAVDGEHLPETAHYVCEHCGSVWDDEKRWSTIKDGEWIAQEPFTGTAGFHLNEIVSPWVRLASMVRNFLDAKKGGDELMKTFINTSLGETWVEKGEAPEWERLAERREDWPAGIVPERGVYLTAGVDVQKDRLECDIWAWGRGLESWLVDHIVIEGGPSSESAWEELTALLGKTWEHANGNTMALSRLAIDTGYETNAVYAWSRKVGYGQVVPVKGLEGFNRATPVTGPTYVDATTAGKKIRRGARLWSVSTSAFKSESYRFLRLDRPTEEGVTAGARFAPGTVHIPKWIDSEWLKQLTSEQLVTVRNRRGFSKLEWQKMRDRNEALDLRVYARAAAWIAGLDRWSEKVWAELEEHFEVSRAEPVVAEETKPEAEKPTPFRRKAPAKRPARKSSWMQ
jgi:phage terminase large subunit GpA-like protein